MSRLASFRRAPKRRGAASRAAAKSRPGVLRAIPRPRLPKGRTGLVVALAAVALLAGGWFGIAAYRAGGILTVARVEIEGNRHWHALRLMERANVDVGTRLHEIGFAGVRESLQALPGVERVSVRYIPGGVLRIRVTEADVVAIQRMNRGWRGLTPGGEWMPLDGGVAEDVPVLEGGAHDRTALRRAAAWLAGVRAAQPELFEGFSQIALRERGEADVYWRDGNVRLRVDCAGGGDATLGHATALLRHGRGRWPSGATVDLRVEGYAYVR